jgi:uncharacterized repeat protein (TIGR02543 family)
MKRLKSRAAAILLISMMCFSILLSVNIFKITLVKGYVTWSIQRPMGIAVDGSGNVYVVDSNSSHVEKFTSFGVYLGRVDSGQLSNPCGIAVDGSGNVYVVDSNNNRVVKFLTDSTVQTWGDYGTGNGQFRYPYGIAVDGSGNVYVADTSNNRVEKFTSNGTYMSQFGSQGTGDGEFNGPYGIAVDGSGNVYVTDMGNDRVEKFLDDGTGTFPFQCQFGSYGTGDGQFKQPLGIAVDSSGYVYVADSLNDRIQKFYSPPPGLNYVFHAKWGSFGTGDYQFWTAHEVCVDSSGAVYVADFGNNRVQKFNQYTLAINKVDPSGLNYNYVLPYEGSDTIVEGTNVTLTAVATHGYVFTGWTGALEGTTNPTTITMDGNKDVIAHFAYASVSVTPNPAHLGETVQISGQVSPEATYSLEIDFIDPNRDYQLLGFYSTDNYGQFLVSFVPPIPMLGLYHIEVKDVDDINNPVLLATTDFAVIAWPGITVMNMVVGAAPPDAWNYLITDNVGTVLANFTLPAGGGTIAFANETFTSGGVFTLTATPKYGYDTAISFQTDISSHAFPDDILPNVVTIDLAAGGWATVTFTNALVEFATQYLDQAPPSDLNIQLPALKPIPVQSAWAVDISGNTIPDLVLGKPMAVLVNLAGVVLQPTDQVTVNVTFEGTQYSKNFAAGDLGIGAIVGFSPIVPGSTTTEDITGNYQVNSANPIALFPTSVTVKATNSLSLYFAYLSGSYGSVNQAAFDVMAQNSVAFLNATYPIKNVTANIVYSGKSITGSSKTGTSAMQADCVAVAAKAKSVMGTGAIGVAIGPNNTGLKNYFAALGKSGAAGVCFGPSTKGVVVLDGYYTAAAHEVAHTYSLYWGKPEQYQTDPPNGKTSSGVWPTKGQWKTGYSFMGTAPYKTLDYSWVDDANTYRFLFNHTATNVADPEIVVVSGLIYKTGEVEFVSDWYHFNQGTADIVPTGDYALKFLDANNNTLEITSFEADFFMHIDPGTCVGDNQVDTSAYGMVPLDAASFVFAAEYPTGTATIQVIDVTKPQTPLAEVRAQDLVEVGNSVTFTQNGLPTGTTWSVTLGELTKSSTTNAITFTGVSSGSYTWSAMAQISGGAGIRYVTALSSGTMDVPAQSSQSITYTKQYQVSFAVNPSGKGTVIPSSTAYYDEGFIVSISAAAQSNYAFYRWNTNNPSITFASSSSSTTTATINGPGTITATFGYLVSGNSNIDLSGSNNVIIITGGNHFIDCRHATSTTILKIGKGNNIIILGGGNNVVKETAGGSDTITACDGSTDIDIAADGNYLIITGNGNDKIQITGNGDSIILAGNGDNVITISGNGSNAITTGSGRDLITVGNGNNIIFAGAGNDNITVGKGNNYVDGGAGYDVCVHGNGRNTIVNCEKK